MRRRERRLAFVVVLCVAVVAVAPGLSPVGTAHAATCGTDEAEITFEIGGYGDSDSSTGTYDFLLGQGDLLNEGDPGSSTILDSQYLRDVESGDDAIDSSGSAARDEFTVCLTRGQTYTYYLEGDSDSDSTKDFDSGSDPTPITGKSDDTDMRDPYIFDVRDADGNSLGENDDGGVGYDAAGTFEVPEPPTADATKGGDSFTGDTSIVEGATDISFDGTDSSDPQGDTLTYTWTWGDGETGSGATTTYDYADAVSTNGGGETFSPDLTVDDGGTFSSSDTDADFATITVYNDFDGDGLADDDAATGVSTDSDDDNDGLADASDPDDYDVDVDNDGLEDGTEDSLGTEIQNADSDGDGIDDGVETDSGSSVDTDGDGTIDALDTDADDDGIDDSVEGTSDTDSDGTGDYRDTDSDGDGVGDADELTTDSDGDGTADFRDTDSDDDGVDDGAEVAAGSSPVDADSDDDGIGDAVETDSGSSVDTDGDGTVDAQDTDSDGDGVDDSTEGTTDTDGDGTADYRDTDSDGDGVGDATERSLPTSRTNDDSDGDGIDDGVETDSGSSVDTDGDGTIDALDTDADDDGIDDDVEGATDNDNDGVGNYRDTDSDGDGIDDSNELGAFLTPETESPVARIESDESVTMGRSVEFDGSGSTDNVTIETYAWDLDGDGGTDATGTTVTHTFESTERHIVELTVTDPAGNTDSTSVTVRATASRKSNGLRYVDQANPGRVVSSTGPIREVGVRFGGPVRASIGATELDPSTVRGPHGGPSFAVVDVTVAEGLRDTPSTITIAVGRANLGARGLAPSDLSVYHERGDGWEELDTRVLETDVRPRSSDVVVLEAETPGFSRFVVDRRNDRPQATVEPTAAGDQGGADDAGTADSDGITDAGSESDDEQKNAGEGSGESPTTTGLVDASDVPVTETTTPGFGPGAALAAGVAALALTVGRTRRQR